MDSGLSLGDLKKIANHARDRVGLSFGGGASLGILGYKSLPGRISTFPHRFPLAIRENKNHTFARLYTYTFQSLHPQI